jgi:iron-sulfur cluster assembly protein
MAVTLTEAAARHVNRYLTKRGQGVGVRLGVKTTGCSGLAYKLEYVDEIGPEDHVFEGHGVKVLIDPKSFAYLDGTELDFVREGLNEGFKFNNPRERDRCVKLLRDCHAPLRGARNPHVHKYVPVSALRAPSLPAARYAFHHENRGVN